MKTHWHRREGQSTVEMIIIMPTLVILAAAVISIVYMSWQGVKVQQAANMAARAAGQEVVGAAQDFGKVMEDNGMMTGLGARAAGDTDPSVSCPQNDPRAQASCLEQFRQGMGGKLPPDAGRGMYWDYRKKVYAMFNKGEQEKLFVPAPRVRNGVVEVKVIRVMYPPKVFDWQMPPIQVIGKAYGGEETYMYGLPRGGTFSQSSGPNGKFWQKELMQMSDQVRNNPKNRD